MKALYGGCAVLLCGLLVSGFVRAQESLPGQLDWAQRVTLSLPQSGVIEQVLVVPGERVRKGQELLRLERTVEQAALEAARGRLQEAQMQLAEAQRERDRARELFDRALLSDHELQLALLGEQRARAQQLEARVQQAAAQRRFDHGLLHAPWDGRVMAVFIQPAQAVVNQYQAVPLLELVDDGHYLARALVGQDTLARLQLGQQLEVQVGAQRYSGTLQSLGSNPLASGGEETRYFLAVRLQAEPGGALHAGMPVSILLP